MQRILIPLILMFYLALPSGLSAATVDPMAADAASAVYRTGVIDPRSASLHPSLTARLKKCEEADLTLLASYLAEGAANDYQKVKRIHDWMTDSIAYDTDSFFGLDDDGSKKPAGVVRLGRTTCGGFAALFLDLCRRVGLEARVIKGISRNYIRTDGSSAGHAWNAVKIEGRWYLVDVTADNRFSYYRDTFGQKRPYNDTYLFIHPRAKIIDNLPERAEDQFLDRAVSREEFLAAPKLQFGVLRYQAEFITDLPALIKKVAEPRPGNRLRYIHDQVSVPGILRLELRVPANVVISCTLKERDRKYDDELGGEAAGKPKSYPAHAFSYAEADRRVCLFSTPGAGVYDAFISAREDGAESSRSIYSFRIRGEGGGEVLPPAGKWYNRRPDAEVLAGLATGTKVEMTEGFARIGVKRPPGVNLNVQLRTIDNVYIKGAVQADLQEERSYFHVAFPAAGEYRLRLVASDPQSAGKTIILSEARLSTAAAGELPPPKTLVRLQALAANGIRIISEDVSKGCNSGLCTLIATAPEGVELTGILKDPAGKSSSANVASGRVGNEWRFYYRMAEPSGRWLAGIGVRDAAGKFQSAVRFRLPLVAATEKPLLPAHTLLLNGAFFRSGGVLVSEELAPRDGAPRITLRLPDGYKVRCRLTDRGGKSIDKAVKIVNTDSIWSVTLSPPEAAGVTGRLILLDPAGKGETAGVFRLE